MKDITIFDNVMESGPWKSNYHWVSQYNFLPETVAKYKRPVEIIVHDSTLRDGEQAPGVSFNKEQKIEIARMLDSIGVQFIEAGFPAVSKTDQDSVAAIASMGLKSKVTCLARAVQKDIDLAIDCGVWAAILEVPVGYPRLKYQFEWEEQELIRRTMDAIEYADKKGMNLILFMIDTARARGSFLQEFVQKTSGSASVKKLSVVDTLGAATPETISLLVSAMKEWTNIPIEVHCHNDFGMGVSNTVAGLMAGAESFSCTVNGLGQRAGNASLEEVVLALQLMYGVPSNLNLAPLRGLSNYVQELSKVPMPQFKAVVGSKLFNWEAGIPVAALRKLPTSVEPFVPELLGEKHSIVLGKKAGKANILFRLEEHGLTATEEQITTMIEMVKTKALEKNSVVSDAEFLQIFKSAVV